MGKTYRKSDENWESKREKEEKKKVRYDNKREFLKDEPKQHRESDEDGPSYRRK
jgi:hypothetical protein